MKLVEVFAVGREEVGQEMGNFRKVGSKLVDSSLCGFVGTGKFRIADRSFFHTFDKSGQLIRSLYKLPDIFIPGLTKEERSYSFVMRYTLTVSTKPMFEPVRASLGDC